jgi:hypothetical protein
MSLLVSQEGVVLAAAHQPRLELRAWKLTALCTDLEALLLDAASDVGAGRVFVEEVGATASRTP